MNVKEYADREMLVMDVANHLVSDLNTALLGRDTATLAVPGGTTPGPIFDILCAADLDWSRVRVMLTDERWVPVDHARSNAGLLRARLFVNRAAAATFVPFHIEGATPQDGAKTVSAALEDDLPLSIAVLGMGADMHTASLFPKAEGLSAALAPDAPALCPILAQGQEPRVTLSARALNSAPTKHLIIFGETKRAALDAALGALPEEAPVSTILKGAVIHWAA